MTTLDDLTPAERPRAMWRYPAWKRTVVMASGAATHMLLAMVILYGMAVSTGLPNLNPVAEPVVATTLCPAVTCPAVEAGIRPGDRITAVGTTATPLWPDVIAAVRAAAGPTAVTVLRDGRSLTLTVDVARDATGSGVIGATARVPPAALRYSPAQAVGATVAFTGAMFGRTVEQLAAFPQRLPAVVAAIGGAERSPDTPISMVGASRLGGEAVERGRWPVFLLLLAGLNLFLAVFNLLPLLPLDGGHILVIWFERVRDGLRGLRGRPAAGPIDFTRLYPVTMALVLVGGAVMVLTVAADVVNPIRLS